MGFLAKAVQFVQDTKNDLQVRSDLGRLRRYKQSYYALPAPAQALFPEPPSLIGIEDLPPPELRALARKYPLDGVNDKRLADEFGHRGAIIKPTFPCCVQFDGANACVVGECSRLSGEMSTKERNQFLLVELMNIYGFLQATEHQAARFAVIANGDYRFTDAYTPKRQKQRAIGLVGPGVDMTIDSQDKMRIWSTIALLKEKVNMAGSANWCAKILRERALKDVTARRLLDEFTQNGTLPAA